MHLGNITKLLCEEHSASPRDGSVHWSDSRRSTSHDSLLQTNTAICPCCWFFDQVSHPQRSRTLPSGHSLVLQSHTHSHIHTNTHFSVIKQEVCVCEVCVRVDHRWGYCSSLAWFEKLTKAASLSTFCSNRGSLRRQWVDERQWLCFL